MNVWILDGNMMENLHRDLKVKYQFATAKDKEKFMIAVEFCERLKAEAIKFNNNYPDGFYSEESDSELTKRK